MKSFSQWLLEWDKADPDSIYHPDEPHGGNGVTFKYDPATDDLETAPQAQSHYLSFDTDRFDREKYVLGRTTGKGEHNVGLLAIWNFNNPEAVKKAVKKLLDMHYVTDDYEVFMDKKKLGTAGNFTMKSSGPKVTLNVPGYGEIDIRQIPALLHTLPETSPAKQVVKNFICNNYRKYDFLASYLDKANCGKKDDLTFKSFLKGMLHPSEMDGMRRRDREELFDKYMR